jgi:hypothetical protein
MENYRISALGEAKENLILRRTCHDNGEGGGGVHELGNAEYNKALVDDWKRR